MKPDARYSSLPPAFWAYVRSISQWIGYADRNRASGKKKLSRIKVPSLHEIRECLGALQLATDPLLTTGNQFTALGHKLHGYFEHRAAVLNTHVEPALMTAKEAETLFNKVRKELKSTLEIPMNKQRENSENQLI